MSTPPGDEKAQDPPPVANPTGPETGQDAHEALKLLVSMATCHWYLKTKHFKRPWNDPENADDDPRTRRALSRLNKSIEALRDGGVVVHDPINERYPPGGEAMMRPIQLVPTAGIEHEVVTETMVPIIYRNERLIQRGEVFVAIPLDDTENSPVRVDSSDTTAQDKTQEGQ